jgi:subtilisin family serine protease
MKKVLCLVLICILAIGTVTSAAAKSAPGKASTAVYRYSVLFNSNAVPADFEAAIAKFGAKMISSVPEIGFVQVEGKADFLSKIKGLSTVQTANPALTWELPKGGRIAFSEIPAGKGNNGKGKTAKGGTEFLSASGQSGTAYTERDWWGRQWDIQRITQNGQSYDLGTGSHNVVVGIIDTGIDRDHPDLVNNLMSGSRNFVPAGGFLGTEPGETGDPDAFDDKDGHGSHVAGSIAANGAMVGVAPNIGIRSYRVFGTSSAESDWILDAMVAAANDGVDVLSMSLGGFDIIGQVFYVDPATGEKVNLGNDVADFAAYKRAVKYATDKGALIVVAAGNDAMNCTNKSEVTAFLNREYGGDGFYFVGAGFNVPAVYPEVVTVSASGPEDVLANYSNYGPGFVEIAAVGGDAKLYDQYAAEGRFEEYLVQKLYYSEFCFSTGNLGDYYYSIGTSMATPKVSAVAALLIDKYGKMSPAKAKELLVKKGVDPVSGTDSKYFGYGHLNAYKALID